MAVDPKTVLQWAGLIAEGALKVAREIKDAEVRREAMKQARDWLTDQKVLLDLELQDMLDEKYK